MDDLIFVRLNAHLQYLYSRIHDEKKRDEFAKAIFYLNNGGDVPMDKYGGSNMALDIYNEIVQIHEERFGEGRTGDAYLEKL